MDLGPVTEATFTEDWMKYWLIDCQRLEKGVAENVPKAYSKDDFRQANEGVSFLAYFPVADFYSLLKTYQKRVRQHKVKVTKEKLYNFLYELKVRLTGLEDVTTSMRRGGMSFSTPPDLSIGTGDMLEYAKANKVGLYRRMGQAIEEWGKPYMIIQRGFGLASSPSGDENRVELMLLGRREPTEALVDKLKEGRDIASGIFTGMFRPGSHGVNYKAWINTDADPAYSNFRNGQYGPFQGVKQTKIFDHRER